ncbi:MAG: hypothetical protein NC393_08110 [Clostridium sp.]|nr:hypothetical protein [Clostridium sp.]MCM1207647.1 hypothetical protein [Ruminococcus sp.]
MSKNIKVKLNREGVRSLLRSQDMMNICKEHADKLAEKCGAGYETSEYTGKNRVNVTVYPKTIAAKKENYNNNTLLKKV